MSNMGSDLTKSELVKRNKILMGSSIAIVIIAVSFFLVGTNLGWFAGAPTQTTATSYELSVVDYYTGESLASADVDVAWYEYELEEDDDVADLVFADFTLMTSTAKSLTPKVGYVYTGVITSTGFDSVGVTTNSQIAEGKLTQLVLGVNTIRMMNSSDDMSCVISKISGDLSDPLGLTNASEGNWELKVNQLDSDDEPTNKEGFKSYFDFSSDEVNYFVIKANFTDGSTLVKSDLKLVGIEDYDVVIDLTNNCTYIMVPATLIGQNEFTLKFSANVGVTLLLESIAIGTGSDSSFVELHKQTFNGN
jgi:hypothetical protein